MVIVPTSVRAKTTRCRLCGRFRTPKYLRFTPNGVVCIQCPPKQLPLRGRKKSDPSDIRSDLLIIYDFLTRSFGDVVTIKTKNFKTDTRALVIYLGSKCVREVRAGRILVVRGEFIRKFEALLAGSLG